MNFINIINKLLKNPIVDTIANTIKKFKSSKSYWSVSYLILLFTIREAIAWKFGSAINIFMIGQAENSAIPLVWEILGFIFEVGGSWELIVLGTGIFLILSLVKISESENSQVSIKENYLTVFLLLIVIGISLVENNNFKNSSLEAITQIYQEKIDKLEKERDSTSSMKEKERLSILLVQANKEKIQKDKEIEELKNKLKDFNFKEINLIIKTKGTEEALKYLNKMNLEIRLTRTYNDSKRYLIKADIYNLNNNYKEAEKAYLDSLSFNKNFRNLKAYSNFLSKQTRYSESIEQLNKMIAYDLSLTSMQKAVRFNDLAILYSFQDNKVKSEKMYVKALDIFRNLEKDNSRDKHKFLIAKTLNNLAILYIENKKEESEKLYKESLNIFQELSKVDFDKYQTYIAVTLTHLASLYREQKKYIESEELYINALIIREKLVKQDAKKYSLYFANTLNNLANLYQETNRTKESKKAYNKALAIYFELSKVNPIAYKKYIEEVNHNLTFFSKKDKELEDIYQKLVSSEKELLKKKRERYAMVQREAREIDKMKQREIARERYAMAERERLSRPAASKKVNYKLTINRKPKDAKVTLIESPLVYQDGIKLQKGKYRIEIKKKGYIGREVLIDLDRDKVVNINLNLSSECLKKINEIKKHRHKRGYELLKGINSFYLNKKDSKCSKIEYNMIERLKEKLRKWE